MEDEDGSEEDEEGCQTWVEALTKEYIDEDDQVEDPDYEVGELLFNLRKHLVSSQPDWKDESSSDARTQEVEVSAALLWRHSRICLNCSFGS